MLSISWYMLGIDNQFTTLYTPMHSSIYHQLYLIAAASNYFMTISAPACSLIRSFLSTYSISPYVPPAAAPPNRTITTCYLYCTAPDSLLQQLVASFSGEKVE